MEPDSTKRPWKEGVEARSLPGLGKSQSHYTGSAWSLLSLETMTMCSSLPVLGGAPSLHTPPTPVETHMSTCELYSAKRHWGLAEHHPRTQPAENLASASSQSTVTSN